MIMIKYMLPALAALSLAAPLGAQAPAAVPSPAAGAMQDSDAPSKVPPRAGDASDPKQLPATASEVPELTFVGLASLGAALALRSAARRRA
jgi:hypothetical protein